MAMKTQGTEMFAIDPENNDLLDLGCVTQIGGVDSSIGNLQTTCLKEREAHTYVADLATPGQANFTINMDTASAVHVRLFELKKTGKTIKFAIGFSDGEASAAVTTGGVFANPTSRSWLEFQGHIASFPFEFGLVGLVTTQVGVQISGSIELEQKV